MVQEGRMAEVIACREAEVKSPVPGHPRMPVEGVVADGMATSHQVREAGEIPLVPVRESGQLGSVSKADVQDASLGICVKRVQHIQEQFPTPIAAEKPVQIAPRIVVEKPVSSLRDTQPVQADSSLTLEQLFSDTSISQVDGKQDSGEKEI